MLRRDFERRIDSKRLPCSVPVERHCSGQQGLPLPSSGPCQAVPSRLWPRIRICSSQRCATRRPSLPRARFLGSVGDRISRMGSADADQRRSTTISPVALVDHPAGPTPRRATPISARQISSELAFPVHPFQRPCDSTLRFFAGQLRPRHCNFVPGRPKE
jgi:hypothetical protein